MLAIQNVSKHFGGLKALENVTIHLGPNKIYGLIGPNGAGKTTLFNLITGMLPVSKGSIQFEGKELNKLRPHEISRLGISRTYQNIRLFPSMTALENVLVAQNVHTQAGVRSIFEVRPSAPELLGQAEELLKQMGLWERRKEISTSLAYGEQRRLEIAIGLATRPTLLLLDEPTAGMSPTETDEIIALVKSIARDLTIVVVEHDMKVVMQLASKISVLYYGEILAEGSPEEIRNNERVLEVYLGRN